MATGHAPPAAQPGNPAIPPADLQSIAVAFSGGGFRATLYHLGVLLVLIKNRLIDARSVVVGVSGGAILAAHWALKRPFDASENLATVSRLPEFVLEIKKLVQSDVRNRVFRRILLSYALVGTLILGVFVLTFAYATGDLVVGIGMNSSTILVASVLVAFLALLIGRVLGVFLTRATTLLQSEYESSAMFAGKKLHELGDNVFLTGTSLTDGSLFVAGNSQFALYDLHDNRVKVAHEPGHPVATFVCASSAFPPAFSPVAVKFPEGNFIHWHYITDGGVFDNLGVRALRKRNERDGVAAPIVEGGDRFIIASDAGRPRQDRHQETTWGTFSRNMRASDLTMYRLAEWDLPRFKVMHVPIFTTDGTNGPVNPLGQDLITSSYVKARVAVIRTDLDFFSDSEMACLIAQGADNCIHALNADFPGPVWNRVTATEITTLLKLPLNLQSYVDEFKENEELKKSLSNWGKLVRLPSRLLRWMRRLELICLLWIIPWLCVIGGSWYVISLFSELRKVSVELNAGKMSEGGGAVNVTLSRLPPNRAKTLNLEFLDPAKETPLFEVKMNYASVDERGVVKTEIPRTKIEGRNYIRCKLLLVNGSQTEEIIRDVLIK